MSDIELVENDNKPSVVGHLTNPDTTDFDLTGCTVKFQLRFPDAFRFNINHAAVVTDAPHGMVRYDLQAGDLSIYGDFQAQWEVTFSGGAVQTTDPVNTITIRRK